MPGVLEGCPDTQCSSVRPRPHTEGAPLPSVAGGSRPGTEEKGSSCSPPALRGRLGHNQTALTHRRAVSKQGYARFPISREITESRGTALLWLRRQAHPSPVISSDIRETFPAEASR